jgi:hypothetical protein
MLLTISLVTPPIVITQKNRTPGETNRRNHEVTYNATC